MFKIFSKIIYFVPDITSVYSHFNFIQEEETTTITMTSKNLTRECIFSPQNAYIGTQENIKIFSRIVRRVRSHCGAAFAVFIVRSGYKTAICRLNIILESSLVSSKY